MPELELAACRSRPLAAYLKALGVLRLVAEQVEPETRGFWRDGVFVLSSPLDEPGLLEFFLKDYKPTPLVAPWNGGSGFYPCDDKSGINAIAESKDPRLKNYGKVIDQINAWHELSELPKVAALDELSREEKKALNKLAEGVRKKNKEIFLLRSRSCLPDCCLPWLDAAYALGEDKAHFTPLLGTGGNEGRLEYANNFMQRVAFLFFEATPEQRAAWLEAALFDKPAPDMPEDAVGQFAPGSAGGVNQGINQKFEEKQPNNPWDFILMFEGTLLFAAALARRSPNERGGISAPFSTGAQPALSAGFASAALNDKSRGEVWAPLWSRPANLRELRRLFGEGRATLRTASGVQQARDGMDFARAAVTLGVDRGIGGFERYAFLERRGQSYVALPGGNIRVEYNSKAELLNPVADYVKSRLASGKEMPESLNRARRKLERALFPCLQSPDSRNFIAVSRALAELDALPTLPDLLLRPCPALQPGWIAACGDSPEARLAAALASLTGDGELGPMRAHLAPVNPEQPGAWDKNSGQYVAFRGGTRELLGRVLLRRLMEAERCDAHPLRSHLRLHPADLLPLVRGEVDWALLGDLLRAFSLVRFSWGGEQDKAALAALRKRWESPLSAGKLPHVLTLFKLLYGVWPDSLETEELDTDKLKPERRAASLLSAGRTTEACGLVARRLRIAGAQGIYLPERPAELAAATWKLSAAEILACLPVPVDPKDLYFNLRGPSANNKETSS